MRLQAGLPWPGTTQPLLAVGVSMDDCGGMEFELQGAKHLPPILQVGTSTADAPAAASPVRAACMLERG